MQYPRYCTLMVVVLILGYGSMVVGCSSMVMGVGPRVVVLILGCGSWFDGHRSWDLGRDLIVQWSWVTV